LRIVSNREDSDFSRKPRVSSAPVGASSQLEALIKRVEANPQDVEALSDLAVELRGAGMTREADDIQRRLAGLAARPATPAKMPERLLATTFNVEASIAARANRSRRATTMLNRATSELFASLLSFPIAELGFTDPLPNLDSMPDDARLFIEQSSDELASGQIMSALDSCLLAIDLAPDYLPAHIRIAEIYARHGSARRARAHALSVIRLAEVAGRHDEIWMARRVLLHVADGDLESLKQLTDALIEARQVDHAVRYANALISALLEVDLHAEAIDLADRLGELAPDSANAALTKVALLARLGDPDGAINHWKIAVGAGADEHVAKASIASLISPEHELDHWSLLAEAAAQSGKQMLPHIADAYRRTNAALPSNPTHVAGEALLASLVDEPDALGALQAAFSDPAGTTTSRGLTALAASLRTEGAAHVAALQTAIRSLATPSLLADDAWATLTGVRPAAAELEAQLGDALLAEGDVAGALEALKRAHQQDPKNPATSKLLADAHARNGETGAALAILDELVIHLRATGQLEPMVETLRSMSAMAPDNARVKSRLIDFYLQRGFVDDARAELLARANIEERTGRIADAVASLQRSADLSWSLGKHEESFATYHRLIALSPDDAGPRISLVNLYLQLGRITDAAEQQRAVVDISTRLGSPHEAIAALHQVIGLTPDDASAYYQLGELLQSMGEHQQAEKVYRRLVLMNPSDHIALEKLAQIAVLKNGAASWAGMRPS
jgi:tetratricopeptide (TPR) repeat protein